MKVSRAPHEFTAPRVAERRKLEATRATSIKAASTLTPDAHKSALTSDFDGGVGGRSALEGVHTHVHAGVVSPGLVESAEKKTRHPMNHAANARRRTCTRTDLYSMFMLDVRVSGISSPFFIQKLSWWTPCMLVRLHCSMRASPSTGSTACSEALMTDSVEEIPTKRR